MFEIFTTLQFIVISLLILKAAHRSYVLNKESDVPD
jgi:hypothetical protein